jgi:hypothetical protein
MMEFPMELDSWSLSFGDQLRPFDADSSSAFDLLGEKSGVCEYGVFGDDIADSCRDVTTAAAWSEDYGYGNDSGYCLTPSPLASGLEQQHDLFAAFPADVFPPAKYEPINTLVQMPPTASPIPELPASPEDYFADVVAYHQSPETGLVPADTPRFPVILRGEIATADVPGKVVRFVEAVEYDDRAEVSLVVPDVCEAGVLHDTEDMLFEQLDDVDVSNVVIDHEKLASIGSFPSVSLDDVLSLLSPELLSVVSATPALPTTTTVSDPSAESPVVTPVYLIPVTSPDANSTSGFSDSASSPGSSAASSPMSGDSTVGAVRPTTERRQRKKEQNKTAALRYREKKRADHGTVLSEYELLERRNTELRSKVDDMTKEIAYLKGLIEEICS